MVTYGGEVGNMPKGTPDHSGHEPGSPGGYQQPFDWWGQQWSQPEPRALTWLIEQGSLAVQEAAFLSLAIEARRTVIIVAEEPQTGKTTLLTALLDFLPEDVTPYFVRGRYERFGFVLEADPTQSYILCNEISHYLPTYLWGRSVRILFTAVERGFRLATTMHASSGIDALARLRSYPLELSDDQLQGIDLIVTLEMGHIDHRLSRRLTQIEAFSQTNTDLQLKTLSRRDPFRAAHPEIELGRMLRRLASWFDESDDQAARRFAKRERLLSNLTQRGATTRDDLHGVLHPD